MIWLSWRQFRAQWVAVAGLVVLFGVLLLIAGRPGLASGMPPDTQLYSSGLPLMYALPGLVGIFWGAPLVARELEAGTHRLVWNQSITRTRWLATKFLIVGLGSAIVTGLLSFAITWWAEPVEIGGTGGPSTNPAESASARIQPMVFGARGIVPVGYALFAFALGVVVGILLRRTLIAMAVTLVLFVTVQIIVPTFVRPYLVAGSEETLAMDMSRLLNVGTTADGRVEHLNFAKPQGVWVVADETVDKSGQVVPLPPWMSECVPTRSDTSGQSSKPLSECVARLADLGYQQRVTYHPSTRFWPLQWLETGMFLVAAGLLAWLSFRWTRRRL